MCRTCRFLRADAPREPTIRHPQLIAIEILSPEDRLSRLQERVDDYLVFGVENIWVIDPESRRVWTAGQVRSSPCTRRRTRRAGDADSRGVERTVCGVGSVGTAPSNVRLDISGLFILAFAISSSIIACHRLPQPRRDHPQLAAGVKMQERSFHSNALDRQMVYRVIMPPDISAASALPVVYLLHGAGNDFRTWSNDSNVAEYARKGVILVMPDGDLSYYVNAVEARNDRYSATSHMT